jgi:tetratricopeptide (TPR) repeat protein
MKKPTVLLFPLLFSLLLTSCSETRRAAASPPPPPTATAPQAEAPAAPVAASPSAASAAAEGKPAVEPDRAAAYYHYSLAHVYEELATVYGRSEFVSKAIDEYRAALAADPGSAFLNSELAELYAKTGRIRDAVLEAQEILKRDPDNLEAHRLLGRVYLRSLGDPQSGQSQSVLKLTIEQFEALARLEPKNVENHLLLGRLYRLNNDLLKAEAAFKRAVEVQPDAEEAVTSLAYLYNEEGDSTRAIAVLESVPEDARSAKIYSALGYTQEQQKNYKQAVAAYQKAVALDKENLDALRGLAQNLVFDNHPEAALEQYKAVAEADPQDAQAYLRMADIYRRMGKFDSAVENLKKAAGLVPDSLEVAYNIALVYEAQGKYEEVVPVLQKLLEKTAKPDGNYSPGDRNNRSVFLERLGAVYRTMHKTQSSIETFQKMLELGDENASRGYQQMIETYRDAKQWPQATAVAKEAAAKLPQDRTLQFILAGQLADGSEPDAALAQVRAMLKGGPEDREVYVTLAQMNSRLKRWSEAEEAMAQAGKLSTRDEEKEYVNFMLGSMYERQKKYEAAEEMFKKILAGDPNNATVLNYLGYMLADRGLRLEEALGHVKRAVELEPQNGAFLDSLGWAYFKLGNYDLAEENLRKATEHIPNDPTIQDHLGDLYQKTGRLKLAAAHWERALEEWGRSVPAEVESADVAKVQKKLESAKVRLARQGDAKK